MSIAQEERQINSIINSSKQRLRTVQEKLEMLSNQKQSIAEDIAILSQRAQIIKNRLSHKKTTLESVTSFASDAEDVYRKLKESSKMLLVNLKKECEKVDELMISPFQGQKYTQ